MSTKLIFALILSTIALTVCEGKPYKNSTPEEVGEALRNLKETLEKTTKSCLDRISTVSKDYYTVMGGIMDSSLRQQRHLGDKSLENLQKLEKLVEEQGVDAEECLDGVKREINIISIKSYGAMISCMDVEDKKFIQVFEDGQVELKAKSENIVGVVEAKVVKCGGDEGCLKEVLGEIEGLKKKGPSEVYRARDGIVGDLKELQSKVVGCGSSGVGSFGDAVKGLEDEKTKCMLDLINKI